MNEKRKILGKIDFKAFVDIFNTMGKKVAVKYVTDTYGVRYDTIVKRLNKESEYAYSQRLDKYVLKTEINSASPFLSVEELCKSEKTKSEQSRLMDSAEIITNLIKDNFFEVSKYITLENSSRKIIIKLDAARNAGYDIEYA